MNVIAYLLGTRALAVADDAGHRRQSAPESLPPIASTPERAAAWRQWAAGRTAVAPRSARPAPVPAGTAAVPQPRGGAPG